MALLLPPVLRRSWFFLLFQFHPPAGAALQWKSSENVLPQRQDGSPHECAENCRAAGASDESAGGQLGTDDEFGADDATTAYGSDSEDSDESDPGGTPSAGSDPAEEDEGDAPPPHGKVRLRGYHGTSLAAAISISLSGFRPSFSGFYGPGVYLTNYWKTASHYALAPFQIPVILSVAFEVDRDRVLDCTEEFERDTRASSSCIRAVKRRSRDDPCASNFSEREMRERYDVIFRRNQIVVRDGVLADRGNLSIHVLSLSSFLHGATADLVAENRVRLAGC